jgi:hypothetical protein
MDLGGKGMAMTGMHFKQGSFFQGYIKCVDKTIAKSMGKKVATHMVVLLSNAFFQSPMCMVEVHHALQINIQLVLVNTEELDWPIEEKAWPLKVSQTRYPFSDGTVNWGDAEFAGNRAAVLRAVTGDNSYPRPGSVVGTWGIDGGIRVFAWIVHEVGSAPMKAESLEVDTEADEHEQDLHSDESGKLISHVDGLWDVVEQGGVSRPEIAALKTLRWNFSITTELGDKLRTILIKRIGMVPSDITDKFFALVVTSYATGARNQLDEDGDGPGSIWNFLVCLAMDLGGKGMAMTAMHFKQGKFFQGHGVSNT